MEAFREFLAPKTVNKFSFTANVCWFVFGAILSSVFLDMEINERFHCDANDDTEFIQGKCYQQYEKRYNKLSIPVYAFVIFNFLIISIVCGIYSQYVKTRVCKLEEEQQQPLQPQQGSPPRKLFKAYCFQLVARFLLGILCISLQKTVFYPQNFPSNFTCDLMENDQPSENISKTQTYECYNQRATKKNFWTYAVIVLNVFFSFLVLIEIFYILLRVCKYRRFMEDFPFYNFYLRSHTSVLPECTPVFIQAMKDNIIKETERIRDLQFPFRPNPGEGTVPKALKLDQIYTNLRIHEGRVEYDFPEDRLEQLKVYHNPMNSSPVKPWNIVDSQHKKVLVVGRPGIGKSLFCIKLLRNWASGKFQLLFNAVFLLKFKRFNSVESPLTLLELLAYSQYSIRMNNEDWNYILDKSNKVLLIFDGIDEFKSKRVITQISHSNYRNDVTERMPFATLYDKLASGKLLPGSTILTTTRPTAMSRVWHLDFDRTVEILGFTSEQIKDYVNKFTENLKQEAIGKTIWQHISSNLNIFSLCYVPVNCFIICTCLLHVLQTLKRNVSTLLPTKLTDIYSIAIKMFYFKHSRNHEQYGEVDFIRDPFDKLPDEAKEDFKGLGIIALRGIYERRLNFESEEVEGLEDCGLLHRLPDLVTPAQMPFETPKAQFCFMHPTIQEFFAAMHITNTLNFEELLQLVHDQIRGSTWHVVLQFVAGLLSRQEASHYTNTHTFLDVLPLSTSSEREQTGEIDDDESFDLNVCGTLIFWPLRKDRSLVVTLSMCLYEIDVYDPILQIKLAQIGFNAADFSGCQLGPVECFGVVKLLESEKELVSLDLNNNNLGSLGCKQIRLLLESSDNKLHRLNLSNNGINDEGVKHLAEALTHSNCKLNSLNLSKNSISDKGVMHLAEALTQSNCKLNSLNLSSGNIGTEGVKCLAEVLTQGNCKLNSLNLSSNYISDEGARHLAQKALTHSNCKLNSLDLSFGNVCLEGVACLAQALRNSNCKLNRLDLSGNSSIREDGVKHLAEALTHSNCKLNSLTLSSHSIGDEGVTHLTSEAIAAHSNCKLHIVERSKFK